MTVDLLADVATIIALPLAAIGLFYAGRQIGLSRRATSAAAVLEMSEAFRSAWLAFIHADIRNRPMAFADVVNLVETTCTIRRDGLLAGKSGAMLEQYIIDVLVKINSSDPARDLFHGLLERPDTFEQIRLFIADVQVRRSGLIGFLTLPGR